MEAKISSSSPPITAFFFGVGWLAVGFFFPRLVILVGIPPAVEGSGTGACPEAVLAAPPLLRLLDPDMGAGGGMTGPVPPCIPNDSPETGAIDGFDDSDKEAFGYLGVALGLPFA